MAVYALQIELSWSGSGSPGVNTFHVSGTDTSSVDELASALATFYTSFAGDSPHNFAAGYTARLGEAWNVETDERVPVTGTGWPLTGLGGTDSAASPIMLVVSWYTAIRGRRGIGRTFVGPLASSMIAGDGTPSSIAVSDLQSAADTLYTTLGTGGTGTDMVVYGLEQPLQPGQDPETAPRVGRPVLRANVRDKCAVLKSRRD